MSFRLITSQAPSRSIKIYYVPVQIESYLVHLFNNKAIYDSFNCTRSLTNKIEYKYLLLLFFYFCFHTFKI